MDRPPMVSLVDPRRGVRGRLLPVLAVLLTTVLVPLGASPGSPLHAPPPGRSPAFVVPASSRGPAGSNRPAPFGRSAPEGTELRATADGELSSGRWYNVSEGLSATSTLVPGASPSPPATTGAGMASDPNASATVLFGGELAGGGLSDQTWVLEAPAPPLPGVWVNVTNPRNAPPGLTGASLVFDPSADMFVMFGGELAGGSVSSGTWSLSVGTWRWQNITGSVCGSGCPVGRYGAGMAFAADTPDDAVVLFGGCTADCASRLNDTWALAASGSMPFRAGVTGLVWSPLNATVAPSPRFEPAFASFAAPSRQFLVLVGGQTTGGGAAADDTWSFYDGHWTNLTASGDLEGTPPAVSGAVFEFDWALAEGILTGGLASGGGVGMTTDALRCDAALDCNWTELPASAGAVPRVGAAAGSDSNGSDPVAFGGAPSASAAPTPTTWVFQNDTNLSVSVSTTSAELGAPIELYANGSGGATNGRVPDSFLRLWRIEAPNGSATNGSFNGTDRSVVLETPGNWTISIWEIDRWDVAALLNATEWIAGPGIGIVLSENVTDVGVPLNFTAELSGQRTAPVALRWDFGDGAFSASPNASHAYSAPGMYTVNLTLEDGLENYAWAEAAVTVGPRPSAAILVSSDLLWTNATAGFTAEVAGGARPLSYTWDFGDGSANATVPDPSHSFVAPGTYRVTLTVVDAADLSSSANVTLRVLGPLAVEAMANVSAVEVGDPVGFSALASGGAGGYAFQWLFGDGDGANAANATHSFGSPGNYTISLWVNDSAGDSARRTFDLRVTARPASLSGTSGPSWLGTEITAVVAVLAVLAAIALRRRHARPPGPDPAEEARPVEAEEPTPDLVEEP